MHTQAFAGDTLGAGLLCIERLYVQLEAWGRLAQWLQEQMPKGTKGRMAAGSWVGHGAKTPTYQPQPAAVSLQQVAHSLSLPPFHLTGLKTTLVQG